MLGAGPEAAASFARNLQLSAVQVVETTVAAWGPGMSVVRGWKRMKDEPLEALWAASRPLPTDIIQFCFLRIRDSRCIRYCPDEQQVSV